MCICVYVGCGKDKYQSAIATIKRETEIKIPEGSQLLYYYYEEGFHSGLYEKYFVLELPSDIDGWLNEYGFFNEKNDSNREEFEKAFNDYLMTSSKMKMVEDKYLLSFKEEYLWVWINNRYVCFNEDTNVLTYYCPYI